jgi:hypothetical protein
MGVPRINASWTALSKADFLLWQTAPYVRKTTPKLFKFNGPGYKVDALIPFGDNLLRAYQIEQVIQLVLASPLRDRLLEDDALNTYEKANLTYPRPGFVIDDGLPTGVRPVTEFNEESFVELGNGEPIFKVEVDPNTLTATINDSTVDTFTYANNLTSDITLAPGFVVRLQGNIGVSTFTFYINFTANPKVDWRGTLARLERTTWRWEDPDLRDIAEQDPLWTNRIAAYAVSAIEDNLDA